MDINILTDDNVELSATLYKASDPKAVVLINLGTATEPMIMKSILNAIYIIFRKM